MERPVRQAVHRPFPFGAHGFAEGGDGRSAAGVACDVGRAVIVENKPGAATVIGVDAVVKSTPDGTPDGVVDYEELLAGSAPIPDARRGGDAIAGVFYTGGTTGFPKGVMLTHASILTSTLGAQATHPWCIPGGRVLHAAPMFHLADLAAWATQTLVGGTHVIVPAFDPVTGEVVA